MDRLCNFGMGAIALVVGLAATVLFGAAGAQAQAIGFVFDGSPTALGTQTQVGFYAYNSTGGAITIKHAAVGRYLVTFAGLATSTSSDVQVTAYGKDARFCISGGWGANGPDVSATVICYMPKGLIADSEFTLLYQSRSSSDKVKSTGAYLWADQPSAASYTPNLGYQFNSTGVANTIIRTSAGFYTVFLPGLTIDKSAVVVTAYGFSAAHCMLQSWVPTTGGVNVFVACTDTSGAPLDSQFDVAYSQNQTAGFGATSRLGGAIWASKPNTTAPYSPIPSYSIKLGPGGMKSQRVALGQYTWTIPVIDNWGQETALVTAYGDPGDYCKLNGFTDSFVTTGQSQVYVDCYTTAGKPVNTQYEATYQTGTMP